MTEDAWETRALKEDLVEYRVVEKVARGVKREREDPAVEEGRGRGAKDEGEEGGTKAARRCSRSASPDSRNRPAQVSAPSSAVARLPSAADSPALADLNRGIVDPRKLVVVLDLVAPSSKKMLVRLRLTTVLEKAFRAYAGQHGLEADDFRFYYEDQRLRGNECLLQVFPDWSLEEWRDAVAFPLAIEVMRT